MIYIREAHSTDGWQVDSNLLDDVLIADHESSQDRFEAVSACVIGLNLTMPALVDTMDNLAERTYSAWPERLYVLDTDGRVAFKCGKGPYGFNVDELEAFLEEITCPRVR